MEHLKKAQVDPEMLDDGPRGHTSRYDSWRYLGAPPVLPRALALLAKTCDMRIPLAFSVGDRETITEIVADEMLRATKSRGFTR